MSPCLEYERLFHMYTFPTFYLYKYFNFLLKIHILIDITFFSVKILQFFNQNSFYQWYELFKILDNIQPALQSVFCLFVFMNFELGNKLL